MTHRKKKTAAAIPQHQPDREKCRDGKRPCPFHSCRHHLGFNLTQQGQLKEVKGWKTRVSCVLDITDQGRPLALHEIGKLMGFTRERARQLETMALTHLHKILQSRGLRQDEVQEALHELHLHTRHETARNSPGFCEGSSRLHSKSIAKQRQEVRKR